jgi:hypothetical protein
MLNGKTHFLTKNLVIIAIILLFVLLDINFFRDYNKNLLYKNNIIESFYKSPLSSEKTRQSDSAKEVMHDVLRFDSKVSNGVNGSISFINHINENSSPRNILAIAVQLNVIPNPQVPIVDLNFIDFDLSLLNFNCYLIKDNFKHIEKFNQLKINLKLCNESYSKVMAVGQPTFFDKFHKGDFDIDRGFLVYNDLRNAAKSYYYVNCNQLLKIKENIQLIDSYSVNFDQNEKKYFFSESEKKLLINFLNKINIKEMISPTDNSLYLTCNDA